jgi:nitronate monooxygenase
VTGVPLAVIRTPYVERIGTTIGPLARLLFRGRRTRTWMRTLYALRSLRRMKRDSVTGSCTGEYWQAGRSVAGIHAIEPAGAIVGRFVAAAEVS